MSGIVEESFNITGGIGAGIGLVIGGVGAVAVAGTVLVGAAAIGAAVVAVRGATALSFATAAAAKEAFSGISNQIQYMKNIALEEKSQYELAKKIYLDGVRRSQKNEQEYFNKMYENISLDSLGIKKEQLESMKSLELSKQIECIQDIMTCSYYVESLNELTRMIEDYQVHLEEFSSESIRLKRKVEKLVNSHSFDKLGKIVDEFSELIVTYKPIILKEISEKSIKKYDKLEVLLFSLEHQLGTPYMTIFHNELSNQLVKMIEQDEQQMNEHNLFELQKEMLDIGSQLSHFPENKKINECLSLIDSVNVILHNQSLSTQSKLEMVEIRRQILKDLYIQINQEFQGQLSSKQEYDYYYQILFSYFDYLGMEKPYYSFLPEESIMQIGELKNQVSLFEEKVKQRYQVNQTRQAIREIMYDLNYEYIDSEEKNINQVYSSRDIYHIENGNVLNVYVNDRGSLTYKVTGVHFDGAAIEKDSIVKSMTHFCDKRKKINELMSEKGIQMETKELFDPNGDYAEEVTLPKTVSPVKVQKLKNHRFKQQRQVEMKRMERS